MPFYEYKCEGCGEKTTIECGLGKAPRGISCNKCEGTAYRIYSCNCIITEPVTEAREGRGKG